MSVYQHQFLTVNKWRQRALRSAAASGKVGKGLRSVLVSSCSSFCRTRTLDTQGERERERDDDRNTHISVYIHACASR